MPARAPGLDVRSAPHNIGVVDRIRGASLPLVALLLGVLVALSGGAVIVTAQVALAFFEITAVEHDPAGRIVASIVVPQDVTLDRSRLTALVDGVSQPVADVTQRDPDPLSVVITIDTSGSMLGAPLAAAQQAALDLVAGLSALDRVAVVDFADAPAVASDFTTNRASTSAVLVSLSAGGSTALYDAVGMSAQLLADAGVEPKQLVLVLLSDGEDAGGVSTTGRDQSIASVAATGAAVYAFALGLQADIDYLSALADGTGGGLSEVADEQALRELFARLGSRLGADVSITVVVPPLPIAKHELILRFRAQGEVVETAPFAFDVMNAGLIIANVIGAQAEDRDIFVQLESKVPLASLDVVAMSGGRPLPYVASSGRILIDPWSFDPGPLAIDIEATVRGRLVGRSHARVEVPELEPRLSLQRDDSGGSRRLVVTGQTQGPSPSVLRVLIDGEEVARSDESRLATELPEAGEVEVRLEDGAGRLLRSETLTIEAPVIEQLVVEAAGGGAPPVLPIAVGVLVVLFSGFVVLLRWRQQ